jgi:ABC-type spermidine/putrescine transport system permease subunit II
VHGEAIYVLLYLLGTFPVTGYTLHWYSDLADEDFLIAAFWNSLFVS